jgi:hypothetical protein
MRRYNIVQPLWMAFYSGDLYDDVARNWRGYTLFYLALITAINWLPAAVDMRDRVAAWVAYEAPHLIEQMPTIALSNGRASVEADGPVLVRDRADSLFMIIDMTGQYTSLERTGARVLVTPTHLHVRNGPSDEDIQTQAFPEDETVTLTRETLYDLASLLGVLIGYGYYPVMVTGSFILRILQAMLFASVASQIAANLRAALPYRTLVYLAIVALTPAILLDTVHDLMETPFDVWLWWPICFFLSMGYLFFAVREITGSDDEEAAS